MQEALAERFRWVQFPRQTFVPRVKPEIFRLAWANRMPLWQRVVIAGMSLLLLIVAAVFAIFVLNAIYLFVSALFSS